MRGLLLIIALVMTSVASASEKDFYNFLWLDPDKSVYVLQKKIHKKKGRNFFQFGYTKGLSSDFQDTNGYNMNVGRYLTEELGIELHFAQYLNENNNAYESIIRVNNTEPFIRKMQQNIGIMGIWSPFYGKINTFNRIYYFDVSFGAGISYLTAESNLKYSDNTSITGKFDKETYTALMFKTDLKLYVNKDFYFQAQLINQSFWANEPQNRNTKKLKFNFDTMFGVGYSF